MKMSCNPLALGVLSCAALCSVAAEATPISLSFSGTIQQGYDYHGEFGVGGTELTGQAVEVRYGFDSSLFGTYWESNGQHITQTVTVGGVSKQYTLDPWNSWSQSYVNNALSLYGSYSYDNYWWSYWYNNYDQIHQNNNGYLVGGGYLDSTQSVYSYNNPMSPPTDGTSTWTYLAQTGDQSYGSFYKYDANWNYAAYFSNTVDRVTLNVASAVAPAALTTNDVPEPATLALTCLALLAVFGTRRALQLQLPRALPPA